MSNLYLDERVPSGLSMHNGSTFPSNLTPANDVIVDAYYVIPYDAIVNQCWDLHRMCTPLHQRKRVSSGLFKSLGASFWLL
jgi:hypothetical protein